MFNAVMFVALTGWLQREQQLRMHALISVTTGFARKHFSEGHNKGKNRNLGVNFHPLYSHVYVYISVYKRSSNKGQQFRLQSSKKTRGGLKVIRRDLGSLTWVQYFRRLMKCWCWLESINSPSSWWSEWVAMKVSRESGREWISLETPPLCLHNPVDICSLHEGVSFVCAVAQVQHQGGLDSTSASCITMLFWLK